MNFGSATVCLRKAVHEPSYMPAWTAGFLADAYDRQWDDCAACTGIGNVSLPIHPRTYSSSACVFPFQAIHNAYLLSLDVDSLNDHVPALQQHH